MTTTLKPVLEMANDEFENYLLTKYGNRFHITMLNEEEFARFEKTANPMVVEIMRKLRAS